MTGELDRIRERYDRRKSLPADRYSFTRPEVLRNVQSVDWVTMNLLRHAGLDDFPRVRLLEVGCGSGGNLLRFLRWGFDPAHLVGNELLGERVSEARRLLPPELELLHQDARGIERPAFDVVYQSTVFSSILDDDVQTQLAQTMWRLTKPGGLVLSYDFTWDNPANPDVRKVSVGRLRELFPAGELTARRVTLAPPLARRVGAHPGLYTLLEAVPVLRTHVVAAIRKPG